MGNTPLQQRAGRNIGIESLPVFIQAAGAPEVQVPTTSALTTLLEAVEGVLRTPFTRGEQAGYLFSSEATGTTVNVYFQDDENNRMLIASIDVSAGLSAPLDISVDGSAVNPFTPAQPLCLFDGEKIVISATPIPPS